MKNPEETTNMGNESSQLNSTASRELEDTGKAALSDVTAATQSNTLTTKEVHHQGPTQDVSAKLDNTVAPSAKTKKKQSTVHKTTKAKADSERAFPVTSTSTGKQDGTSSSSSQLLKDASTSTSKPKLSALAVKDKPKIYDGLSETSSGEISALELCTCLLFLHILFLRFMFTWLKLCKICCRPNRSPMVLLLPSASILLRTNHFSSPRMLLLPKLLAASVACPM